MSTRSHTCRLSRVVALGLAAGLAGFGLALATAAACPVGDPEAPTVQRAKPTMSFPQSWFGRWKGDAVNDGGAAGAMQFTMEMVIGSTDAPDRFQWTVIYDGATGRQERRYELVVKDAARGEYIVDEKNSILLDARLLDGGLYSHFLVQGTRITTREKLEGAGTSDERISVEMIVTSEEKANASGKGGDAPEVLSWMPRSIQRATLRRVPDGKPSAAGADASPMNAWTNLPTEKYPGKQDDIVFLTPQLGWYVNGAGKIFKTTDGGATWIEKLHKPGTYFRCIAFVDELIGVAGNIGPGYFPNVTDETPLYRTTDGGETWAAVESIEGPKVVGLCAIEVLREQFVNAGNFDTRTRLIAVGRVGGPGAMIYSDDLGATWKARDIKEVAAMAFDVHFFDRDHGVIAAGSDTDVTKANALILTTNDGGATWTKAYQSARPYELTWKISFPTREVGYVTIQSYNPDPAASQRYVAKTVDGGKTWTELPLVDDAKVREFGVAFIDAERGWIGAMPNGFATTDGGATWMPVQFGNAVNKIRVLREGETFHAFAIGVQVAKTSVR